jgi:cyclase
MQRKAISIRAGILLSAVWMLLATTSGRAVAAADAATVEVLPVRPGNVYMLTAQGINVTVQTGPAGTVVVDPGPASSAQAILAAISKITSTPIRFLIDTSADPELIGASRTVAAAGQSLLGLNALDSAIARSASIPSGSGAATIVRQSVLTQMLSQPGVDYLALPSETFTRPEYNFFLNGPVAVIWQPAAHSNGDAVVRFDRSDVVATGAIFDQTRFPVIDLKNGGTIQGEINALDEVINSLAFAHTPVGSNDGGTLVIPVRGPLSDLDGLVSYRDMVATVVARVQYYIDRGRTYRQIVAADPAQGYHTRYGSDTGSWTTADFVDAVYKSLMNEPKAHHGKRG